ncbi:MAG: hypothetical protein U0Q19_06700 [Kineosporiaceae bacterium]
MEEPAAPSRTITARARALLIGIRADSLIRNSFYLMVTTGTMAVAGFVFWVVNTHLFSPEQVGRATALVTAVAMLSHLALAGMNSTVVRHLNDADDPGGLVSGAIGAVALAATVLGLGYLALLPLIAPSLTRTMWHPAAALAFALLTVGSSVNLFTDSVFVARRAAGWNLALDGVLLGGLKIVLPFVLAGAGMFGIFLAAGLSATVTAVISLMVCHRRLGLRLRAPWRSAHLTGTGTYAVANYVANALNLLPVLVMPLALLERAGAAVTAGFFIAFQIATILNSVSYAASEALFAETSFDRTRLRRHALHSLKIMTALLVPAVTLVLVGGNLLLSVFGPGYGAIAGPALRVLAISALPVALYSWGNSLLRITGQLVGIVTVNLVYAVTIIGLVVLWAPRGAVWASIAWAAGNLAAGLVAVLFVGSRTR